MFSYEAGREETQTKELQSRTKYKTSEQQSLNVQSHTSTVDSLHRDEEKVHEHHKTYLEHLKGLTVRLPALTQSRYSKC